MLELHQFALFFLVLARVSAFFTVGPLFSMTNIPVLVRLGLSLLVAMLVFPLLDPLPGHLLTSGWYYVFALFKELLVGLALGYVASLVLAALLFAGGLLDFQVGFFMSSVFDPMSGAMAGIVSRFLHLFGLVVLLVFNGHHMIINALVKSFSAVPINMARVSGENALFLIKVFAHMITIGVQIAVPVIAVLLVVDITLGLIARTAPQINVFMLGFPIKILFGLVVLSVMVPVLVRIVYTLLGVIERDLMTLMKGMT